jgi:hypothetical protein
MVSELREVVVPMLRAEGFRGSIPHFRRPSATGIDLLTFQFDRWGGGFVVEIARSPIEGVTTHWGALVPPSKVTAQDLRPENRLRLKPQAGSGREDWFRFDDGNCRAAAQQVACLLPAAELWWNGHAKPGPQPDGPARGSFPTYIGAARRLA